MRAWQPAANAAEGALPLADPRGEPPWTYLLR